ncbi:MAG TPA: hypothetical protein VFX85_01505 [Solirubrobacterales bacterium]|nr:hypothetical protein [Solirubrobacterales bacterium]
MNTLNTRRTRLGSLLAVALGAAAIFVLPGLASAKHGNSSDDGTSSATIKSFDQATQTLVVALPNGETVTGTVNRRTKIRCEDQSGHRGRGRGGDDLRARHGSDDDSDDDNSGSGNSGSSHDDNGRGANCTTADLVAGAAVEEIELDFGVTSVHFDEVELDD